MATDRKKDAKAERLAAALRENLKKRKEQARQRRGGDDEAKTPVPPVGGDAGLLE